MECGTCGKAGEGRGKGTKTHREQDREIGEGMTTSGERGREGEREEYRRGMGDRIHVCPEY